MRNALTPDALAAIIRADIEKAGAHILHVQGEGDWPPYSHSVGFGRSMKVPDVVVVGLPNERAEAAIYGYRDRLLGGTPLQVRTRVGGLLPDTDVEFRDVHPSHFPEWFAWNVGLYGTTPFRVLQMVYPANDGSWPWEPQASAWFRKRQPLLESPAA